ncbi:MAG: signal peptide peptidase SppA, partial [Myxococcales bacterium]|nr:signal peptide peptidase SppA [Myxococcales bacterium]
MIPRRLAPRLRAPQLAAAALGLSLAAPKAARAQAPEAIDRPATDGVDRVYKDYSGEGDASSIELNPALLSAAKGVDLALLGYRSVSPYTRGTGLGGFLSLNLGLGVATGFGVQAIRPRFAGVYDFDEAQNPDLTKISWALSAGDAKVAALGVAVHGVRAASEWLRRPDVDVGLLIRIRNYASLGASARFGPVDLISDGLAPELGVVGEMAFRPLGTRMVEFAGGVRARFVGDPTAPPLSGLDTLGVFPRGRLALRWQGIELLGEVEQVRTHVLDEQTKELVTSNAALRGSVALGIAWDLISVRSGVHTGISPGVDGVGFSAHLSTAQQGRVYWPRQVDAERLRLKSVQSERDLIALLERLERAERAGERSVLVVEPEGVQLGWASLEELRLALRRVRDAGGHVFAYVENASLKEYYVASVAEHVYVHHAGELSIVGLKARTLYFKDALAKLGVAVEGLHIDEYKSAHERFTRTGPSKADREQRDAFLDDIYERVVYDVAQARGLGRAEVMQLIDGAPLGPEQAERGRLVDQVVYRDELLVEVGKALGAEVKFRSFDDTAPATPTWADQPYVAVVLVEGTIRDGESLRVPFLGLDFAGADTIAKSLRELRDDPACVGVVLRVNSPGGSALASDIIWREVERTHAAHAKDPRNPPIVVSMSDVAASGGYYVAMGAPHVLAQRTTLTGSIGVVSLHFDVSGLLAKLGISEHTFTRGKNADLGDPYRPLTADQRARLDASMTRVYDLFRERVAAGRDMTPERVHELGRGHVYSGVDAQALDLIDGLGGLREAIASLAPSETGGSSSLEEYELDPGVLSVLTEYEEHRLRTNIAQGVPLYRLKVRFSLTSIDTDLE